MKSNPKKKGFSLLELLAVVTILGIIAAIIVPRVTVSSDSAKAKVQSHQIATLNAAIERYYIDNNSWPTALSDLVTNYVPDGIPTPPQGGSYGLNTTTNRVTYTP
ncbi:MAG: prepilin-type N-terminal cleavage/methylation domain-containing protein [Pirellulales bacterium]|nr:prepilin-type N-terminal cleavage/methylation domain-containing protein [Pirellulales bacterium]